MFRPYLAIIRFFFFLKVSLYKLGCGDLPSDYNSRCLCIGVYYNTLIYIYMYSLSVGRGGGFILGVSAGCQPPLLQGVAVTRLSMVGLAGTVSPVGEHKL